MATPSNKKPNRLGKAPAVTENNNTVGNNTSKPGDSDLVPLNFKVESQFKRDLKSFAAGHDMSMVNVLKEAFELYRSQKGG